MDPAIIALIGTVCGGVGLKALEHMLSRGRLNRDDASKIRDELRLALKEERTENADLERAVEKWKTAYYDLRDKHIDIQTRLQICLDRVKKHDDG